MKKLLILIFAVTAIFGFNACSSEDDVVFVAQPDPEGISFTSTFASSYVLTQATLNNIAERFVWNFVDYEVPTNENYELQASTSTEFTDFDVLGASSGNNVAVTVQQLWDLAADAGLDNDPTTQDMPNTGQLYFRVVASAGTEGGMAITSEVQALTVVLPEATEEEEEVELPKIYMVGNFQAAGGYGSDWTPADGAPLAASAPGEMVYEGFVYINAENPEFKFTPTNEGWDGDYGDAGSENGTFTGNLVQEEGVNAGTPDGTGGYYLVEVNLETLTYSLTKVEFGVIGNATPTGWDSDTDMVYDPESMTWSVDLTLTQQEAPDNGLKFRANDAWDIEYGDNEPDGILDFKGTNIGVPEAGEYTIILDLSNPRKYTYSLNKK